MAERLLSADMLPTVAEDVDADAYDRKVLKTFLDENGRLIDFPAQQKKEEAVLRHIVKVFEPGRRYSEKEVTEMLSQFNEDYARLRRDLVDTGLHEARRWRWRLLARGKPMTTPQFIHPGNRLLFLQ